MKSERVVLRNRPDRRLSWRLYPHTRHVEIPSNFSMRLPASRVQATGLFSNRARRARSLSGLRSSHSHTTMTRHPSPLSVALVRRSRATFSINLRVQKSTLLLGV